MPGELAALGQDVSGSDREVECQLCRDVAIRDTTDSVRAE